MFIPRIFEKYTNYNGYVCDNRMKPHKIELSRLLKVLADMQGKYKNPYIRFMWMEREGVDDALCILYSDFGKGEKATKLVTFTEVEKIILG